MKNRLNITVDNVLMEEAKLYAVKHKTSVSQLVEQYFKTLTRKRLSQKENFIDFMSRMSKPKIKVEGDYKKDYYESRKKKYGF